MGPSPSQPRHTDSSMAFGSGSSSHRSGPLQLHQDSPCQEALERAPHASPTSDPPRLPRGKHRLYASAYGPACAGGSSGSLCQEVCKCDSGGRFSRVVFDADGVDELRGQQLGSVQTAKPALGNQQQLPDHRRGVLDLLEPLRRLGAQPCATGRCGHYGAAIRSSFTVSM